MTNLFIILALVAAGFVALIFEEVIWFVISLGLALIALVLLLILFGEVIDSTDGDDDFLVD